MGVGSTINRRNLFKYGAATGTATAIGAAMPAAHAHAGGLPRVLPAPKPIPGGIPIPGGPLIHTFLPGPTDVTLPFTALTSKAWTSSRASSPTTGASPPWPTTSARPPAATAAATTWRPTSG
jgi:hypothetical protein